MVSRTPPHLPSGPLISGAWFQWVVRCLDAVDVPLDRICEELDLDLATMSDPDGHVDRDTATRVWREAAKLSSDPLLGLHAAEHFQLGLNSLLAHLMVSSANVEEALHVLARYQSLVTAGPVVSVDPRDEGTAIVVEMVEGRLPFLRHQLEFVFGVIARMVRTVAGPDAEIAAVRFKHSAGDAPAAYRASLGCRVEFDARENSLILPRATLDRPSPQHSPIVVRKLKGMAEEELENRADVGLSHLVEVVVRHRLRAGEAHKTRLGDVARELHLSERSLQRRLAEESLTYAAILDAVRRDVAEQLLEGGASRERVAARVGFSNTTTFSRALRRWRGH